MASPRKEGGGKIYLQVDLWPCYPKSIGFLPSSSTTYMWSLKRLNLIYSLYCAHMALYTECQSWPLTPLPKINRVPPPIIHNLHVKFERDWAKTVTMYPAHKVLYAQCQNWPWPLTQWPKINRFPTLIIHNFHVKFESDWAKTEACIVFTRSCTQSAKVDLDLWPHDPKSIGFHLLSYHPQLICEVWKWLGKNWSLYSVTRSCTQSAKVDLDLWPHDPKSIGFSSYHHHKLHVKFTQFAHRQDHQEGKFHSSLSQQEHQPIPNFHQDTVHSSEHPGATYHRIRLQHVEPI